MALNSWCYWTLRREGQSVAEATRSLVGASTSDKNELLYLRGINFSQLPAWQRRGTGAYWETYTKQGIDPRTQTAVNTERRRVRVDEELPMKVEYGRFVRSLVTASPELEDEVTA
jgi:tRNA(His) 5'-end guanylyltransferase